MKTSSTFLFVSAFCLLAGQTLFSAVPLDLTAWDASPRLWKTTADGLYGKDPAGFAILADEPLAIEQTVTARFRIEDDAGDGWGTAGIALVDDAHNFWHLALVRAPKDAGRGHFFELTEMYKGEWLSQQKLEIDHREGNGTWKVGDTLTFKLVNDGEGILGEITDPDGKILFNSHYRFTAPASTRGRPAVHLTGGMKGTLMEMTLTGRKPLPPEPKAVVPYQSDAYVEGIRDTATGFFRVVRKPDGRWWTIDPLGRGVVVLGVDHVTFHGHWCETLKQHPHLLKNQKKYPSKQAWEEETLSRLKKWGFNMLGAGSDPDLQHRGLIHTCFLSFGENLCRDKTDDTYDILVSRGCPCSAFPNVFHPDFAAHCRFLARRNCTPNRDDPWLLGYFIDNELAWWGRGGLDTGLFDAVMQKAPTHTAKTALRDFLRERAKDDLAAFNALWGTKLENWDAILPLQSLPHTTEAQREVKLAFLRLAAERYFAISAEAIRQADPNHLVLGARFAGTGGAHPVVWEVAGKYCDIVTFNCYPWADLDEGVVYMHSGRGAERADAHFTKYFEMIKRPILLTEWSFPALDAGLPSTAGAGQRFRTQAERTKATELFAKTLLSLPFMIGYDYFMWVDEPALGITSAFPENSNYGLVNEDCEPYPLITGMFESLQRAAGHWRNQPVPKPTGTPLPSPPARVALQRLTPKTVPEPVACRREGDAFTVTTACGLTLSGAIGERNQIAAIQWKGKAYGAYNAMVQCLSPGTLQRNWLDGARLTDMQFRSESGRGVLELTSRTDNHGVAFEIVHRLTVLPDRPVILCEFLTLKNLAETPLATEGLYFRLYAPFTDTDQTTHVPNLWRGMTSATWLDKNDGRFIGMTAPFGSDAQVYFWTDNSPHSDARFMLPKGFTIAPNATFEPATPFYVITVLGEGGEAGWGKATDAIQKELEVLAPSRH